MSPWRMDVKWYMKCFTYWTADHIELWITRSWVRAPLGSWLFQSSVRNCLNCVHITAEAVGAGELKRFKDFTGIQRHGSKFASHKSRSMHFVRTLDDRIIVLQWVIMIILMEDLFIILTKNALSGKGNQDIAWTAIISFCNVNYCLFKSFLFLHIELPFLKGGRQWFLRC